MLFGVAVVVVVPAWEEAPRIGRVLRTMPPEVDAIIVVDDASTDGTAEVARADADARGDARVEIVRHARNRGVGAAIVTGYRRAMEQGGSPRDAFVVMAGDGQMDPADLPALVAAIARGDADYVKGDRFGAPDIASVMPRARLLGGKVFSWLTSHAIDVPISDSQCGYTAIARGACERLALDDLWPGYGYPNDLLAQIARRQMRIFHAPVRPVYADEVSRLAPRHVARIAQLVGRAWVRRALRV